MSSRGEVHADVRGLASRISLGGTRLKEVGPRYFVQYFVGGKKIDPISTLS